MVFQMCDSLTETCYVYVRSKQKVRSHVAQLIKKDNTLTGSDEEATNELSSFFRLVFVKESDTDGPEIDLLVTLSPQIPC